MSGERIPIEGLTVDAEPNDHGRYMIRGSGTDDVVWSSSVTELVRWGIPVPPPPVVIDIGDIITWGDGVSHHPVVEITDVDYGYHHSKMHHTRYISRNEPGLRLVVDISEVGK